MRRRPRSARIADICPFSAWTSSASSISFSPMNSSVTSAMSVLLFTRLQADHAEAVHMPVSRLLGGWMDERDAAFGLAAPRALAGLQLFHGLSATARLR